MPLSLFSNSVLEDNKEGMVIALTQRILNNNSSKMYETTTASLVYHLYLTKTYVL